MSSRIRHAYLERYRIRAAKGLAGKGKQRAQCASGSSKHYGRLHVWFRGTALLMTASAGGAVAGSLQNSSIGHWILIGMSGLASVLTSLQTFRRFDRTAERHQVARASYASIRREIERLQALDAANRGTPQAVLMKIEQRLNLLARLNTPIPEWI